MQGLPGCWHVISPSWELGKEVWEGTMQKPPETQPIDPRFSPEPR